MRYRQEKRRDEARRGVNAIEGVRDYIPTPLLPANVLWSGGQTRRLIAKVCLPKIPDFVFIDQPLFPATHFPSSTVIFRPTDVFTNPGLQRRALRAASIADGVAATSQGVLASVAPPFSTPTTIIENGVEFSRFASAATSRKDYDFVYVGALDERFDFGALVKAAELMPDSRFAIFGPIPSRRPRMPANVDFRGPIPYEDVPQAIAVARVGLMPFTATEANASRSPMKLYEYVAAGLCVVAPEYTASRAAGLDGVIPYTQVNGADLASVAQRVLVQSEGNGRVDQEVASQKDWGNIAAQLLSFAEACRNSTTSKASSPPFAGSVGDDV